MEQQTAIIADYSPLFRAGIAAALERLGVDVVHQTSLGGDVPGLAHGPASASLVVLGSTHDLRTEQVLASLQRVASRAQVIALMPFSAPEQVTPLVAAQVSALLPRSTEVEEFLVAVKRVAAGERVVDPVLLAAIVSAAPTLQVDAADAAGLTGRERVILQLLAQGHPNREIAARLSISVATVRTHSNNLYRKLGVSGRRAAVERALALGLLW